MEEDLFAIDELMVKETIAGCDEAGRGPLVGPVVAACVVLPEDFPIEILGDSKKLTEKQRDEAAVIIREKATAWAITSVPHDTIDEINILNASLYAMRRSYEKIRDKVKIDRVLIDGNKVFDCEIPTQAVVKGDDKIPEIMAASILAKTYRDHLMEIADRRWPQYDFKKHKGYPTKEHLALIAKYGPCPIARKSFHVKKMEKDTEPELI